MGLFGFGKNKNTEERKENSGNFVGFVLLSKASADMPKLAEDLKKNLDIGVDYNESSDKNSIVISSGETMITVSFMPAPVPNGEAEHYARANYMWREAEDTAKAHKAHIIAAVLGKSSDTLEKGRLFVKTVLTCLDQKYASAVYSDGAVFEPSFYRSAASVMQDNALPVLNWIWFGIYKNGKKVGVYTYGMKKFGKDEMEIYADGNNADLNEIRGFAVNIAIYVLENDVTLRHGETIGLTAEQKLPITKSKGIALDGQTLKIKYS